MYNTVKGWHVRTYPDEWPSADNKGGIKDNQQPTCRPSPQLQPQPQPQTGVPYQQQAGDSLQISPAFSPPQHRQGSHQHQHYGYAPQLPHAAVVGPPYQKVIGQRRANKYDPQMHILGYHSMFKQDGPQYRCHGLVPQMPPGASDSLYQQDGSQYQPNGYVSQLPTGAVGLSNQQDHIQYQQNGCLQQIPTAANDRGNPTKLNSLPQSNESLNHDCQQSSLIFEKNSIDDNWSGEPFPDLSEDLADMDNVGNMDYLDGDLFLLPADGQQLNMQDNVAERQPNPASQHQRPNPLQHVNHRSVPQLPADPLTIDSRNDRTYSTPNPQQLNCSFEGQHGTLQPSAKRYRSKSISDNPHPTPQHPIPPDPTMEFRVLHNGHRPTSWRLIGGRMVIVDPDEFHTHRSKKRVKGRPGREIRDSIAPCQEQLNAPNFVPQESLTQAMQSCATRNSTVNYDVLTSKILARSDLNDSGYVSLDSALRNSLRLSFSSLNLTDDVDFETNYKEAGGGFVDVFLKWRMRRSHIEKLNNPLINDPFS